MTGIELHSAAFSDHSTIPLRYSKDGENVSPPLTWSGVPDDTEELVLLCEDPDAPSGSFVHWLVTGIPPDSHGVDPGQAPPGTAFTNGFGDRGWDGPLPPVGDNAHRYIFHLYALPDRISLSGRPTAREVHRAIDRQGELASGTLVGLYQR
ncbi:YbhB/YbcL family Raf kinase inhibitor-like protein [Streptomyces sp. 7N604]|uniref:YbhB/YbcL family Raf kinase inhibitor-like protein n=1 Tax=Streptomyces sp. 7N604 TaxID=3457415 RepID=UPI003FD17D26